MSGPGFEKASPELLTCSQGGHDPPHSENHDRCMTGTSGELELKHGFPLLKWLHSEGRTATGAQGEGCGIWSGDDGVITGWQGRVNILKKHTAVFSEDKGDRLMKEPNDGSRERSSTGVPPFLSAPAASIKLCVLFI